MKFILGKKLNMSQVFTVDGKRVPVTVIEAGPCKVIQVKTKEKDGYSAVQIGFGKKSKNKMTNSLKKHQKDGNFRYLREFHTDEGDSFKVGDEIVVKNFTPGEYVDVIGIMKGRGYAGAMKRHYFHGFPASHGHDKPRSVGSIGTRFPQHTLKGKRMAGRMGGHQVTMKNLLIMDIDAEKNLIWVQGPVPGSREGLVKINFTGEKQDKPEALYMNTSEKPLKEAKSKESPETPNDEKKEKAEVKEPKEAKKEAPAKEAKE